MNVRSKCVAGVCAFGVLASGSWVAASEPGDSNPFQGGRQVWKEYDLSPYTAQLTGESDPQKAVVQWILDVTGHKMWHGSEVAVLSASPDRLRVFHNPEVQTVVGGIVERFTSATNSTAEFRVLVLTCGNLDWRDGLLPILTPEHIGPEGQQVWVVASEDASLIRSRLLTDRTHRLLAERSVTAENGQEAVLQLSRPVNHVAAQALVPGKFMEYQPVLGKLGDGLSLRLAPLWLADGSGVEIIVDLSTSVVNGLHNATSRVPLRNGSRNASIQIPQVSATRLTQRVELACNRSLVISAGVHPEAFKDSRGIKHALQRSPELLVLVELCQPRASVAGRRRSPRPVTSSARRSRTPWQPAELRR